MVKTGKAIEAELYRNKYNKQKGKQGIKWRKFKKEKEKFKLKGQEAFQNVDKSNLYK